MPRTYLSQSDKTFSDSIRYRDGLWIAYRKKNYVYWFKFLQFAEADDDFVVDWDCYEDWGGKKAVLNMKFDLWWEDYWIDVFGVKEGENGYMDPADLPAFPLNTKAIKSEAIRLSYLCWLKKDEPIAEKAEDEKRKRSSNKLDIALAVYRYETGESGEKKGRLNIGSVFDISDLNWKDEKYFGNSGEYGVDVKAISDTVTRALNRARETMKNVCVGKFP